MEFRKERRREKWERKQHHRNKEKTKSFKKIEKINKKDIVIEDDYFDVDLSYTK